VPVPVPAGDDAIWSEGGAPISLARPWRVLWRPSAVMAAEGGGRPGSGRSSQGLGGGRPQEI
jgi:hypothetical protein